MTAAVVTFFVIAISIGAATLYIAKFLEKGEF